MSNWDSSTQTVYVHNSVDKGNDQFEKKSLTIYDPDKDSDNDNGWHYKWASTFENIILDNPYYMFTLDADGGELGNPKSISKLGTTENKWPEGPGTLEANWELINYKITYKVDGEVYTNSGNEEYFNVENHIIIETTKEKSIGKMIFWDVYNTKYIDLSQADNDNSIVVNGTREDWITYVNYEYNGGYKKAGDFPISIRYSNGVIFGELYRPGYRFIGWCMNGKLLSGSYLINCTEEEITLTAEWNNRVLTNPDVQIPNDLSYYRIIRNGAYIMPKSYVAPLHIEIMSGVDEVYLYSEGNFLISYSMYITIHTKINADFNLHLDNFQINAPLISIDGKDCPQSGIYVHTESTVPIWSGINTPSSIPINPVVPGFNPPIVPGPTYPTIIPTANYIGGDITTYATLGTVNYGGRLNLYAYNDVRIYGASGKYGTLTNKDGGNGTCAIYCENFTIKYADNLYIKGGDSGRPYGNGTEGEAACAIVCVYSIDEWYDPSGSGQYISFDIHQLSVIGGCASNLCKAPYYVIGPPKVTLPPIM